MLDADILDIFSRYGDDIVNKGSKFFCKSPFVEEKSASCLVNVTTQTYKCFSTGKSGNIITYLKFKKNFSYPEVIEELAKLQGKPLEYENTAVAEIIQAKRSKEKDLRKYLEALLKKFQQELKAQPKDAPVWQEIAKRGYTEEDVAIWDLGFAPGNNFMYRLFSDAGNIEAGKKLGLLNDKNQDKLWDKLLYPMYDDRGQLVGFASRKLDDNPNFAKWMNPSDNELYDKSSTLYGLNFAKNAIVKHNRVWVVEGYNDVIAWHKAGLENTVGICGTALTDKHMKLLKKLTSKVTLCLDGDSAGKKAMLKYLPELITLGFSVEVCTLPGKLDPDDYSRKYIGFPAVYFAKEKSENPYKLETSLQPYLTNGFETFLAEKVQGDELDRNNGIKEIVKMISKIGDAGLRNIYTEKLTKDAKLKPAFVKILFKEQEAENVKVFNYGNEKFNLPNGVTMHVKDIEPIVDKYELFVDNNQIYMADDMSQPISFHSISNFSIEILQHMNDDKFPKKLLRVCNTYGEERIFDVPANTLNAPQRFKDALTDQGNYRFEGNQKDLDKLAAYLFDKMGVGRKVDVLGWNPEGFYCWNNAVTIPGKPSIPINKDGIFHFDGHTYYVPSANEIYKTNPYRFALQKKLVLKTSSFGIEDFLAQMYKVHGDFGLVGILFAFASAHQDVIFNVAKGFPEFFLYGPASTGKDQIFSCIKRMFGLTETDLISLENGQSTPKSRLRTFAETSNMVVHLSEWTNSNKENVGMAKELWGKNGYKIGTMDSKVSTDTIPILCSAMISGNEYPNDTALLSRLVFGEMSKNLFDDQEVENYKKLAKMLTESVTGFMDKVIWQREAFEENFADKFNLYKKTLSKRPSFAGSIDRIITNYAILGATFEILRDVNAFIFPFGIDDILRVFDAFVTNLRSKISSASIFIKFWDLFILGLRGNTNGHLKEDRDYRIDGDILSIQFTGVFTNIQREWFPRYNEACPNKKTFQDDIKNESYYKGTAKKRMIVETAEPGKEKSNAVSVYELDLTKMPEETRENIINAVHWQRQGRNSNGDLFHDSPATPYSNNGESTSTANSTDRLGF